jgi:hypothetical protein
VSVVLTATGRLRRALPALALLGAAPMVVGPPAAAQSATARPAVSAPARCVCPDGRTPAKLAKQADAVFTASVVSSTTDTAGTGKKQRTVRSYTAEVDRSYQGSVTAVRVLITSDQSQACGYGNIPTKTPWLFFVNGRGAKFNGNVCGGAMRATVENVSKVERLLGQGTPLQPAQPPREPLQYAEQDVSSAVPLGRLVAPGAAVTLIGLLGLVLFRRRTPR